MTAFEVAWRVAAAGGVAYLCIVALLYLGQRRLIYLPDRTVPDPAQSGVPEMTARQIQSSDGLSLLAWHRPPARPGRPTIVYFHGNACHIGVRAEKVKPYLDAGYGVLLPAYRGYSGNPGKPSETLLYADAEAGLRFLEGKGADGLVLYGESLGSGVAVEMARRHPVRALVLEAPFTSTADVGRVRYPFLPIRLLVIDRFDSKAKIERIDVPLLIVHGEKDRIVPVGLGRALFDAAREPKEARFIPEARHNDLYDHGMAPLVLDFLERHLPQSATVNRNSPNAPAPND
ncbi:MAG: alpha/beta hydrolase [Alphaproteobacteria bacterium]|nr:alpha/beta hydrolase [Pseudomonadota bacterium]